jgi:hypothetical protein
MSTRLKVMGGTRSDAEPRLCDTCRSGLVTRGAAESDEQVFCMMIKGQPVGRPVVECNRYVNRTLPSLWDMRQIAWVLETDSKRQRIGFIRAKEWERRNEDCELLPTHPND